VQTLAVPVVSSREPDIEGLAQFQEYIRFTSIDPAKNRYRIYTLTWHPELWGGVALVRAWGRIGGKSRFCSQNYLTREEALQEVDQLIKRRLKRGYQLVTSM
jgi:predicted DNA-binding WGR domain protein